MESNILKFKSDGFQHLFWPCVMIWYKTHLAKFVKFQSKIGTVFAEFLSKMCPFGELILKPLSFPTAVSDLLHSSEQSEFPAAVGHCVAN